MSGAMDREQIGLRIVEVLPHFDPALHDDVETVRARSLDEDDIARFAFLLGAGRGDETDFLIGKPFEKIGFSEKPEAVRIRH
jgi:hypothetical protein